MKTYIATRSPADWVDLSRQDVDYAEYPVVYGRNPSGGDWGASVKNPWIEIADPPPASSWLPLLTQRRFTTTHQVAVASACGYYVDGPGYPGGHGVRGLCGLIIGAEDAQNYHAAILYPTQWPRDGYNEARTRPWQGNLVIGSMVNGTWIAHETVPWEVRGVNAHPDWSYSYPGAGLDARLCGRDLRVYCTFAHNGRGMDPGLDPQVIGPIIINPVPRFSGRAGRAGVVLHSDGADWVGRANLRWVWYRVGEQPVHQSINRFGACAPALMYEDVSGADILQENEAGAIVLAPGTPYTMLSSDRLLIGTAPDGSTDPGFGDTPWNSGEFGFDNGFDNAPWGDNTFN